MGEITCLWLLYIIGGFCIAWIDDMSMYAVYEYWFLERECVNRLFTVFIFL